MHQTNTTVIVIIEMYCPNYMYDHLPVRTKFFPPSILLALQHTKSVAATPLLVEPSLIV
jgi:hypothetical protein